jgi:hypothetical protein
MYKIPQPLILHDRVDSMNTFNSIQGAIEGVELLIIEQARHLRWEHDMKVVDIQARLGQTRHWVITNTKREQSA